MPHYALSPTYLFTPKGFLKGQTLIFDTTILAFGPSEAIAQEYPDAVVLPTPPYSILTPGFINLHVHLEFSSHTTQYKYGQFLPWLYSVMAKRDELVGGCDTSCHKKALQSMLESGTTTIGAISSYGTELQACVDTPQRVLYFSELIGSNAAMVDALYGDFLARLNSAQKHNSSRFEAGIAIHSPYAVHPILIQKALDIAQKERLSVTAHLLESPAEYEWLTQGTGDFAPFFAKLLHQSAPLCTPQEFVAHFAQIPTLFTHATQLDAPTLALLSPQHHAILHCPISNRLLGNGVLDIEALYEANIPYMCATDGLSSNTTLDIRQELQSALFLHAHSHLPTLALALLHSVTTTPSYHTPFNVGRIEVGMQADMVLFALPEAIEHEEDIALHLILQHYPIEAIFIDGQSTLWGKNN
ncbi:MAG: hypothetical protein KU37_04655 [Sulfuricurvum sp. PC08-66]|nr:MAG: hypothetical protein KU37_04655 [Sulfuricurvum sp. PC08-66]